MSAALRIWIHWQRHKLPAFEHTYSAAEARVKCHKRAVDRMNRRVPVEYLVPQCTECFGFFLFHYHPLPHFHLHRGHPLGYSTLLHTNILRTTLETSIDAWICMRRMQIGRCTHAGNDCSVLYDTCKGESKSEELRSRCRCKTTRET